MRTEKMILTGLFAALTSIGALISIPLPFSPVPVTLQIFFTFLSGVILGSKYGALSQLIYILLGGFGLPVFAGGTGGFHVLIGPTAGYLWGFVLASFIIGKIIEIKPTLRIIAMLSGLMLVYLLGVFWLYLMVEISLQKAFFIGVLPFIPGDLIKIIILILIYDYMRKKFPYIH